jgi:hypothetical protein
MVPNFSEFIALTAQQSRHPTRRFRSRERALFQGKSYPQPPAAQFMSPFGRRPRTFGPFLIVGPWGAARDGWDRGGRYDGEISVWKNIPMKMSSMRRSRSCGGWSSRPMTLKTVQKRSLIIERRKFDLFSITLPKDSGGEVSQLGERERREGGEGGPSDVT